MDLIEFLLLNGSIEFVAVICEKFRKDIEPYQYYSHQVDFEDKVRETAKRIVDLSKNKEQIKLKRKEAKQQRDQFSDKGYVSHQQNKPQQQSENQNKQVTMESYDSYDPYTSNKSLQQKIGVIMEGVDKMQEKDEDQNENQSTQKNDVDLLDFGTNKEEKKNKKEHEEEVDFLQLKVQNKI